MVKLDVKGSRDVADGFTNRVDSVVVKGDDFDRAVVGVGDVSSIVLVGESSVRFDFERRLVMETTQLPNDVSAGTVDLEDGGIVSCSDEVVPLIVFGDTVDVKVVVGVSSAGTIADRSPSAAL